MAYITAFPATSRITVAPAPMRAPAPIATLGSTRAPLPKKQPSPTVTQPVRSTWQLRVEYAPSTTSWPTPLSALMAAKSPTRLLAEITACGQTTTPSPSTALRATVALGCTRRVNWPPRDVSRAARRALAAGSPIAINSRSPARGAKSSIGPR